MVELVRAREYARRRGVDERQVRRGLARGVLHRGRDGKLDSAQLRDPWHKPNRRTLEKRELSIAENGALAEARLEKERSLAALHRLEYEDRANSLIPRTVRSLYAPSLEEVFIKNGFDMKVRAKGTELRPTYALMSQPLVYKFTNEWKLADKAADYGFTRLVYTNGFTSSLGKTWTQHVGG